MALFEHTPVPGAPYLIATVITLWAFLHSYELPVDPEVVHAKYVRNKYEMEDAMGLLESEDESVD
jgi:hypothetical protein